jgi:hypothetical protein
VFLKTNTLKIIYKYITAAILLFNTACSDIIALNSKNHNYQLKNFELIAKECKDCQEQLQYVFYDNIAELMQNKNNDQEKKYKYKVEIKAKIKKERSSIRIDGTAMRSKIFITLEYQIIDNIIQKSVYQNSLFQLDTTPTTKSLLDDFSASETLSIQLMTLAINELKSRLIFFAQNND